MGSSRSRRLNRKSGEAPARFETAESTGSESRETDSGGNGPHYRWGLTNGRTVDVRASGALTSADLDLFMEYLNLAKRAAISEGGSR